MTSCHWFCVWPWKFEPPTVVSLSLLLILAWHHLPRVTRDATTRVKRCRTRPNFITAALAFMNECPGIQRGLDYILNYFYLPGWLCQMKYGQDRFPVQRGTNWGHFRVSTEAARSCVGEKYVNQEPSPLTDGSANRFNRPVIRVRHFHLLSGISRLRTLSVYFRPQVCRKVPEPLWWEER